MGACGEPFAWVISKGMDNNTDDIRSEPRQIEDELIQLELRATSKSFLQNLSAAETSASSATMYVKLLLVRLMGSGPHGEIEVDVRIGREGFGRQLAERNLPLTPFGEDVPPVLEVGPPRVVAGNGETVSAANED